MIKSLIELHVAPIIQNENDAQTREAVMEK